MFFLISVFWTFRHSDFLVYYFPVYYVLAYGFLFGDCCPVSYMTYYCTSMSYAVVDYISLGNKMEGENKKAFWLKTFRLYEAVLRQFYVAQYASR